MKSLRELFKIGRGPSSSHTIGPEKACEMFSKRFPEADAFKVILYGSLSKTGRGHGTDYVIEKTLPKPVKVIFDNKTVKLKHPNTMELFAFNGEEQIGFWRVYSIGGGTIEIEGEKKFEPKDVYPHNSFEEIRTYLNNEGLTLPEYVVRFEGEGIREYLMKIWQVMQCAIEEGLTLSGVLPGGLSTERKAKLLYTLVEENESPQTREHRLVSAYAFAVAEQNASGEKIVTAPTCGASGILPAVLRYAKESNGYSDEEIIDALMVAGIIGNIVKTNASISGAECGCQAECGTACSMASASLASLMRMNLDQIEYSAEVAMEHHLGLTCDPVAGLVQIPCIERNAVSAMRAINGAFLAKYLTSSRQISFDAVVETMYNTGKDIKARYRETSIGGLAKSYDHSRLKRAGKKKK